MTHRLDASIFGEALVNPYSVQRSTNASRMAAARGRPRYRARDQYAAYTVQVEYDMDHATFGAWQSFWASINHGAVPFLMRLKMLTNGVYWAGDYTEVQAVSQWSASITESDRYRISLSVEVPGSANVFGALCDVYYGGPLTLLAPDYTNPGTPSALATDVIGPCPGVLA